MFIMSRLKIIETKKETQARKRMAVTLRILRAVFGITQRQLAEASGVSFSALARFERGDLRLSDETLSAILINFNHRGVTYDHQHDEITLTVGHAFLKTLYEAKSLAWPVS